MDSKIRVVGMKIDAGWCVGMKTENRMYIFIQNCNFNSKNTIEPLVCVECE